VEKIMKKEIYRFDDDFTVYDDMTTSLVGGGHDMLLNKLEPKSRIFAHGGAPVYVIGDNVTPTDLWVSMMTHQLVDKETLDKYRIMVDEKTLEDGWAMGGNYLDDDSSKEIAANICY
jgi:hypothetical protein